MDGCSSVGDTELRNLKRFFKYGRKRQNLIPYPTDSLDPTSLLRLRLVNICLSLLQGAGECYVFKCHNLCFLEELPGQVGYQDEGDIPVLESVSAGRL